MIESLKKQCNAFIPDFFGVHDMYLLSLQLISMSIHDDLSAFWGVKIKRVVTKVALGSFSLNTNEAPTKTRIDI